MKATRRDPDRTCFARAREAGVSVVVVHPTTVTLADGTQVDVIRSSRRRRSVSASREGGRTVLSVPARMSVRELTQAAEELHARLLARETKRRPSDARLLSRSRALALEWLGGHELPDTVRWVTNMRSRWASCTPVDRTIRVSDRLQDAPDYVLDYVLVHELAHLIESSHNADFWALVEEFPRTEAARAWLDGFTAGQRTAPTAASFEDCAEPGPGGQGVLFPSGGSPASSSEDRSSGAARSA